MPFKSKAQMRYLYANEPQVAKEFADHTKSISKLPEYKKETSLSETFSKKLLADRKAKE